MPLFVKKTDRKINGVSIIKTKEEYEIWKAHQDLLKN